MQSRPADRGRMDLEIGSHFAALHHPELNYSTLLVSALMSVLLIENLASPLHACL